MSKRGNGEGSIRQRADGRWEGRLTASGGKRLGFYGATRAEVSAKLKLALADQERGLLATGPSQTVEQYLRHWLDTVAMHTTRPTTFESYERLIRLHVVPILGRLTLTKLTAQHLQSLYSAKLAEGLSPRTVQYVHAVVHRALEQAMRWDIVARNVADLVDAPTPKRAEMRPLSDIECATFLEAARGDRLEALYVCAVSGGFRQAELLGLRWRDVDFATSVIHVTSQVQRVKGKGLAFSEPKTAKGRRSVTLPGFAVAALQAHRLAQLKERLLAGSEWVDLDLVFPNHVGKPVERQNLMRRSFWPLLDRAGLARIRFHDLRHTSATLLLSLGVHPKVVQERLGHSTIGVTLDVYSHVLPSMQIEAAGKLEGLLGLRFGRTAEAR